MKKYIFLFLLVLTSVLLVGCGDKTSTDEVKAAIKDAETMTYEELLVKAKEEVGDDEIQVFGNSSALVKALVNFEDETGIKVKNNRLGDVVLYERLFTTISNNTYSADMVLIQDGNKLQTQMINTGFLLNYVPKDYKSVLPEDDQNPTAAVYLNKVFMYNNTDGTEAGKLENYLYNVWQLAGSPDDDDFIPNVSFKPGSTENVNMNFLIMLTSPEWVTKLEAAYKSYYGKDYVKEDEFINIGYKWIHGFMSNHMPHSSDGTATKNVAKGAPQSIVYANLNKLKSLNDEGVGKEDDANITTSAFEGEGVEGFSGFLYKMYTMIPRNAKYPYAAAALVNYILSEEGFTGAWGVDRGYYSTNPNLEIAEGDKELAWWKERTVIEDPVYVAKSFLDVSEFVLQLEIK